MTELRTKSSHSDMETISDEHTEGLSEKPVSVHRDNTRFTSKSFEPNEEYWTNSTYANGSSDDDLPLAQRSTRRAAASPMIPPDMSQTSRLEPLRKRREGPPMRENTQLSQENDTNITVSTPLMQRRRRDASHSYGPSGLHADQEEARLETDEEMAIRLQERFKREAGFSDTARYNAHHPAELASDVQTQWIGPHADRGSDSGKVENCDTPLGDAGLKTSSAYPVYSTNSIPGHPADQDTGYAGPVFGMITSQAISNSPGQQYTVHSTCWENRLDHLPFRTSCNFCDLEMIACSKHHPSLGFCYQHGRPRKYNPVFLHNVGLEDPYDALQDEPPPRKRQISGVRKFVAKPKPPKVLPLKKQEAILRELRPKEHERGPPPA